MKGIAITLVLFYVISGCTHSGENRSIDFEKYGIESLSLNGIWQFSKDNYEIEYKRNDAEAERVKIVGLRGVAKIYNLKKGRYSLWIRRLSNGEAGYWSSSYSETIN